MLSFLVNWINVTSGLVFLTTLLTVYMVKTSRMWKRLPPGPFRWPLVGNLPQMMSQLRIHSSQFKMFQEFSRIYGPIFSMTIGFRDNYLIIITDYKLIKEVLKDRADEFNERPTGDLIDQLFEGNGILFASGEKWHDMRRFTTTALRDFGVGSRTLEHIIQEEAEIVCDAMVSHDKPFQAKVLLGDAVANIICNIIFGSRFDYNDKDFQMILEVMDHMNRNIGTSTIDNYIPFLKYIPINTPGKKLVCNREKLREYTYKRIEEHRKQFDPNNIRDYIDLYLKIAQEGSKFATLTEPHVFQAILDLYFAGAETTATSLDWFILYMVVHPEIQAKCQQEIDRVIGHSRKVNLDDRVKLRYVNATILELQRIANIVPFTIPHMGLVDRELGGYNIPAQSVILPMLLSAHLDPRYWDNPEVFNPDRWLDKNGNLIKSDQHIPFGMGPHKCLGESLAKMELLLFVTFFLQRYSFRTPEGHPTPSLEADHTGITQTTKPYFIQIKQRFDS